MSEDTLSDHQAATVEAIRLVGIIQQELDETYKELALAQIEIEELNKKIEGLMPR